MSHHDFKNLHRSNWPERADQHPSIWEQILAGAIMGAVGTAIMFYALIQATGGYQ